MSQPVSYTAHKELAEFLVLGEMIVPL